MQPLCSPTAPLGVLKSSLVACSRLVLPSPLVLEDAPLVRRSQLVVEMSATAVVGELYPSLPLPLFLPNERRECIAFVVDWWTGKSKFREASSTLTVSVRQPCPATSWQRRAILVILESLEVERRSLHLEAWRKSWVQIVHRPVVCGPSPLLFVEPCAYTVAVFHEETTRDSKLLHLGLV